MNLKSLISVSVALACVTANAEPLTGALIGSALVQSISLGAASQVSVKVGLGPIASSVAVATVSPTSPVGSISSSTMTPNATVGSSSTVVSAAGPGSSALATASYSSSVLTIVPVIDGTQVVISLTAKYPGTIPAP